MPHKKLKISRTRLITATLLVVISAPLAANLISKVPQDEDMEGSAFDIMDAEERTTVRETALVDKVRLRKQRREYWQAMKMFQHRTKAGEEDLVPPDMNDYESITWYLSGEKVEIEIEEVRPAAPAPEPVVEVVPEPKTSSLTTDELGEKERHLLRRYMNANNCPETLKDYSLEGFYELCLSVTKAPTTLPRQGLSNPIQWLNRDKVNYIPTMKLRMQMLEQALDRSNRRESVVPGRPTPYINY
ncbi:hypothetical protein KJ652_03100 [Patescibacteria group bacterium]|nr:hypothetical protein [Patescibacteria group bacterium]MBU1123555.1 hypothetical protein [Patescibacteria group bacterium]MBU1911606.1 hypothetical protein [Patescibacteria group bacterium]